MADLRTGLGFDVHRSDAERTLHLGGLVFAGEPGLVGHSDGDAVCHAIADALLGAVALGDVGQHFPDTDPSVAGIAGTALLARTVAILVEAGHRPVGVDEDRDRSSSRRATVPSASTSPSSATARTSRLAATRCAPRSRPPSASPSSASP